MIYSSYNSSNPVKTEILQHVLPVKIFELETRFDKNFYENNNDIIIKNTWQFLYGSQKRIESKTVSSHSVTVSKPKSIWDAIKIEIIKFDSTLNFGWLSPRYSYEYFDTLSTINNTYINVVPLDRYSDANQQTLFLLEYPNAINYT